MNPIATLFMENGAKIVVELLPEAAPNTVNSFIYAAKQGFFDNHVIERFVPGNWIDMSYRAFGHEEAKYLIPAEFTLNPELEPIEPKLGTIAMGGYGEMGLAGCEFFFPLRDCPDLTGTYPVFGLVKEGIEELKRLEQVEIEPVTNYPGEGVVVNKSVEPQILRKVELQLFEQEYPEPIRVKSPELPECWLMSDL